jgi:Amt family ammonium transporter
MTLVIGLVLKYVVRMRLTAEEEQEGMDYVLHGETAYELSGAAGGGTFGSQQRPGSLSIGGQTASTTAGV